MRLTELEPKFLKRESDTLFHMVDTLGEADGLRFLCPVCWKANKGPVGTHGIMCWSPSVPLTTPPVPGRWSMVGTGFHDLSLVAGSSSILIHASEREKAKGILEHWHGHITDGEVTGA